MIAKLIGMVAGAKKTLMISAVVFAVGLSVGAWATNKFYAASKIAALEAYNERMMESHENTIANLKVLHQEQMDIAKDQVKIKKVKVYVKDNRECDLTVGAVGLLDSARTGLSTTASGTDEGLSRPSTITQRRQIESCANDGIQYRQLKSSYDGLRRFINDNWKVN